MILIICKKARQGRIEVGKDFNHDGNENCDTPVKKAEFIRWKLVGHDILSIEDSSEEGEDKGNCDNDSNCGDYTKYSPHRLGEVRYPPVCYEGPSLWFCFVAFELGSLLLLRPEASCTCKEEDRKGKEGRKEGRKKERNK